MKNRVLIGAVALVSAVAARRLRLSPRLGWVRRHEGHDLADEGQRLRRTSWTGSPGVRERAPLRRTGVQDPGVDRDRRQGHRAPLARARTRPTSSRSATPRSPSTRRAAACATSPSNRCVTWGSEDWLPGLADPGSISGVAVRHPLVRGQPRGDLQQGPLRARRHHDPAEDPRTSGSRTPRSSTRQGNQGIYLAGPELVRPRRVHLGRGRRARRRAAAATGRARWTPRGAQAAWTSTRSSRRSATGPRTPTRRSPRRPTCSPRATSPRSSPCPAAPQLIEQTNPELKGKLGFFPDPRQDRRRPGAVFTGGSDLIVPEKAEPSAAPVSTWSRRSRARSGRPNSPAR